MKEFLFESRPSFESYTCVEKGAVVGWTALTRFRAREDVKHTAEMSLYVQDSFRRKGIGSTLAHTILNRAKILNLHCVFALVFKEAPSIVSFAKIKCEFSVTGCLPGVFSDSGEYHDIFVVEKLIL